MFLCFDIFRYLYVLIDTCQYLGLFLKIQLVKKQITVH